LLHFRCTIDHQEFDIRSLNISHGGALIETNLRLGSVALVVPDSELKEKLPVALVGLVVRHQESSPVGYGIQWQKCVTKDGIQRLYDFLALYLNLYPSALPLPSPTAYNSDEVEYSFRHNRFKATSPAQ